MEAHSAVSIPKAPRRSASAMMIRTLAFMVMAIIAIAFVCSLTIYGQWRTMWTKHERVLSPSGVLNLFTDVIFVTMDMWSNSTHKLSLYLWSLYTKFFYDIWKSRHEFRIRDRTVFDQHANAARVVKRLTFVRHGESQWNTIANAPLSWAWVKNLFTVIVMEISMLFEKDSLLLDAPLTPLGMAQAIEARHALCGTKSALGQTSMTNPCTSGTLKGVSTPILVVTSNLRRCITTAYLATLPFLQHTQTHVMTALQETTANPDSICIQSEHGPLQAGHSDVATLGENVHDYYVKQLITAEYRGNVGHTEPYATRFEEFARLLFAPGTPDNVLIFGHSAWFRSFCRYFTTGDSHKPLAAKRLANCSVASFDLVRIQIPDGEITFIDNQNMDLMHARFLNHED